MRRCLANPTIGPWDEDVTNPIFSPHGTWDHSDPYELSWLVRTRSGWWPQPSSADAVRNQQCSAISRYRVAFG